MQLGDTPRASVSEQSDRAEGELNGYGFNLLAKLNWTATTGRDLIQTRTIPAAGRCLAHGPCSASPPAKQQTPPHTPLRIQTNHNGQRQQVITTLGSNKTKTTDRNMYRK